LNDRSAESRATGARPAGERGGEAGDPPIRQYAVGLGLLLATAMLWSLNGALVKLIHLDGQGPSALAIAFYRSLFAGLFLVPLGIKRLGTLRTAAAALPDGAEPDAAPRRPFPYIRPAALCCVLFFAAMTVCFVGAMTSTEAANAIILQYTSTFWIFGLSPLLLGERARRGEWSILALAMVGVLVIFFGRGATDQFGLTIALASGLFYALLTMMIRRLRDADAGAVTLLNNLGSALLILPVVLVFGELWLSTRSLLLLIVMGVVQFGLPYWLYTIALKRVPAYQVGMLTLIEPLLVPLWTWLAVGEAVPMPTVIGGGIVLTALAVFARRTQKRMRRIRA